MARRTRQCPRTLVIVYDPDEEQEPKPAYDWDAWEKNRFTGWNRWWFILMLATTVALTISFFQGNGSFP